MPTDPDRADVANDSQQRALDALTSFRDWARATNLARVETITEALVCLRDDVLPEESRLAALRAVHTLVGSAGTFGFGEASLSLADPWRPSWTRPTGKTGQTAPT